MKRLFLIIGFLFYSFFGHTQTAARFHSAVKIEFEKTVYMKQMLKENEPGWYDMVKDRIPETVISYFNFTGDTTHSLYEVGREVPKQTDWFSEMGPGNVVYNNYRTKTTISQKPVFEETFLVSDSLLKIKWRLTADSRNIAGFECRKAVGIIDDTIAVFAFYTDEILVNGGPEGIHGLPGMILGLGFPRVHTTWFATRVEVNGLNFSKVKPATKGTKATRVQMLKTIENVMKDKEWGKGLILGFLI